MILYQLLYKIHNLYKALYLIDWSVYYESASENGEDVEKIGSLVEQYVRRRVSQYNLATMLSFMPPVNWLIN